MATNRVYLPGRVPVSLGLTPEQKVAVEVIANKTSRTRAEILQKAVEEYLERSQSLLKDS